MILCGVDSSEEAAHAARFAAELAVRAGSRLVLLHVATEPWVSTRNPDYSEQLRERMAFDRAGHLQTVVNPILVDPAAPVERVVEFGRPVDVLRSTAEELRATHLVVGSRGQGAVEEVLAASTSGPLAREAPCPVVLVPPEAGSGPGDWNDAAIVCGVDASDGGRVAGRRAGELARRLHARLVLATVTESSPEAVVDEIRAALPEVVVEVEARSGQPSEELLALARAIDARLVVVGSRGQGAVSAALLGSVSGRVVQESDRPVMVVSPAASSADGWPAVGQS
jgi:nucleotide-binding universal stress UspA family protein